LKRKKKYEAVEKQETRIEVNRCPTQQH